MYIGGGGAENNNYTILEYTIQGERWRQIETPVAWFGMAVVNNQLLIIGGEDKVGITNQVWLLDSASGTWTQPFPPMSTTRRSLSAVGYKRWVLVVGGLGGKYIEMLDTAASKWYMATPLPYDAIRPSLTVIQDTLYVVSRKSAVSISIPILIFDAVSKYPASDTDSNPKSTKWQSLPNTLTMSPALTSLEGSLVAVGRHITSSSIAMYLPHTKQWLELVRLPTPRQYHTCAILQETQQLMVIGGQDQNNSYIKSIELCTI